MLSSIKVTFLSQQFLVIEMKKTQDKVFDYFGCTPPTPQNFKTFAGHLANSVFNLFFCPNRRFMPKNAATSTAQETIMMFGGNISMYLITNQC